MLGLKCPEKIEKRPLTKCVYDLKIYNNGRNEIKKFFKNECT